MKSFNCLCLLLTVLFVLNYSDSSAQELEVSLKIKSEHKQLFSETGMLKELADDLFHAKAEPLKQSIEDWIKKEVKTIRGETMHSAKIKHSSQTKVELKEENNKIYISYILTYNHIEFCVTTPEVFGVGVGKFNDPNIYITYDIRGDFELRQNGTIESIKLMNPKWYVNVQRYNGRNLQDLSFSKDHLTWMVISMRNSFNYNYLILNEIQDNLNNYFQTSVLNNVDLNKEFELDGNKQLHVKADLDNASLIFQHNYSTTGIVKRNATKEVKDAMDRPKFPTNSTIPVSTSPSGMGKKPGVLNRPTTQQVPVRKN